ncbi:MAG: hypothetical protein Q9219_006208 [cf. Caloplaca sp. 3 TL-2023]
MDHTVRWALLRKNAYFKSWQYAACNTKSCFSTIQYRSSSSKRKHHSRLLQREDRDRWYAEQDTASRILRFRQITDDINKNLSPSLGETHAWVVRILHNIDRKYRANRDKKSGKALQNLVELTRQAYQSGSVPSTSRVPLHLLSYYKESGQFDRGLEFWDWLSKTEAKLNPTYVGAAIELLAVYGAGIDHCEHLYERTLAQQSDVGSQYHMSPGAVLPDRSQAITIKGTSSGLLQGILTARLFYGKLQRSYLTLDTIVKLRPTQIVPRALDLFIYERPIFEALPVFFMYCRGGNTVPQTTLSTVLKSMRALADKLSEYSARTALIRAMFQVVEAYVGSAGKLNTIHLNIVIEAVCTTMPSQPVENPSKNTDAIKKFLNDVVATSGKILEYFTSHHAPPNQVTFRTIISKASSLGYPDLVKVAAHDMMALGIMFDESMAADLMKAAHQLQDPKLVKTAWSILRKGSTPELQKAAFHSWKLFAAAARSCGLESFLESELQSVPPGCSVQAQAAVLLVDDNTVQQFRLTDSPTEGFVTNQMYVFAELCSEVRKLLDRLQHSQYGSYTDMLLQPLKKPAIFEWPENAEESWQRSLYDELTRETRDKEPRCAQAEDVLRSEFSRPAISDTGILFEELRYMNWKTINSLLVQTEAWERRLETSTNAAIQEERALAPGKRPHGSTAVRYPPTVEQLKAYNQDVQNEQATHLTEEEWRERILRLRTPEDDLPLQPGIPSLQ